MDKDKALVSHHNYPALVSSSQLRREKTVSDSVSSMVNAHAQRTLTRASSHDGLRANLQRNSGPFIEIKL